MDPIANPLPCYKYPLFPQSFSLIVAAVFDADAEYIDFTNERLTDLGDMSMCTKLEEIVLRLNFLPNSALASLNQLPNLINIDLYENKLTPFEVRFII